MKIAELFPNCLVEAKDEKTEEIKRVIDFDHLQQELSGHIVEGPRERYSLNWPGKRKALFVSNQSSTNTLRPCPEESVEFEHTKNIFIEGDNLECLKLLQQTQLLQQILHPLP